MKAVGRRPFLPLSARADYLDLVTFVIRTVSLKGELIGFDVTNANHLALL